MVPLMQRALGSLREKMTALLRYWTAPAKCMLSRVRQHSISLAASSPNLPYRCRQLQWEHRFSSLQPRCGLNSSTNTAVEGK